LNAFSQLGLSPALVKAVAASGYEAPTPIQVAAIPHVLSGSDIMGLAQTGTGKTAAFGLPLIDRLEASREKPLPRSVRSLILAPTRELANQIADSLRGFARQRPLSIRCVVGGASINMQVKSLERGADILVATPGRLLDLVERNALMLGTVRFLVLDEADQMLDLGFIHALRRIARLVSPKRQTLLFSATMPAQIEELSRAFLSDPVRVETAPAGKAADKVRQVVHHVPREAKANLLRAMLSERPDDLSLVFCRTKHGAEKLMKGLVAAGLPAASIHGNKSQGQRDRAIRGFRDGEIRILVATDVAARGIDIPGVSHVYNYDLPEVAESYVHRIGRTARAGADGQAVAFCTAEERHLLKAIEKLMGMRVDAQGDPQAADEGEAQAPRKQGRGRGRGRNPGQPQRGQTRTESRGGEDRPRQGAGQNREDRTREDRNRDERNREGRNANGKARPAKRGKHAGGKPVRFGEGGAKERGASGSETRSPASADAASVRFLFRGEEGEGRRSRRNRRPGRKSVAA
jgi:ATP-dependent RNA helicase RhlE